MLKAFSKTLDEGNFTFVIGMELFRAAYINHYCPIPFCNIFFSWLFLQYCGGAFKIYGLTKHFTMLYFFSFFHIISATYEKSTLSCTSERFSFSFQQSEKIFSFGWVFSYVLFCFQNDRMDNLKFGQCPLLLHFMTLCIV